MSWEAVTWANRQKLKKSYEQILLLVLANCADPNGEAFVKWPHREHWWHYLSERTRLPKTSLFRHLNTLVALGLCDRAVLVLADGARRPTLKLNFAASFDIDHDDDRVRYDGATSRPGAQSPRGTDDDHSPVGTGSDEEDDCDQNDSAIKEVEDGEHAPAPHSPVGTGNSQPIPKPGTEPFPVLGMQKDSIIHSKTPPLPPSGGVRADPLWDDFVRAWGEPIPKMAIARAAWDRTETGKRTKIVAAARGYWDWLKSHRKPPSAQSAQSFIRDEAGWEQWLRYLPADGGAPKASPNSYPIGSAEASAITAMYAVARVRPFQTGGALVYRGDVSARVLAFAGAPDRSLWVWIEDRNQIGAWSNFLKDRVTVARPSLTVSRGVGESERRGMYAPWPWPPRADGTIAGSDANDTGPPDPEMTADDDQVLASESGRG
jgi:hypothetical protein